MVNEKCQMREGKSGRLSLSNETAKGLAKKLSAN
jgi:hypothetical protein